MELFLKSCDFHLPLRALGVRACDLSDNSNGQQLMFFEDAVRREKRERLESNVDLLRGRFGKNAVKRAVLINDDITGESDPLTHEVHPVAFNF